MLRLSTLPGVVMAPRTQPQYVHELPKKLDELYRVARERGVMALANQARAAEALGVHPSRLSRPRNPSDPTTYCRLGPDLQRGVGDLWGFDVTWKEWRDAEAEIAKRVPSERSDTAAAFIERYLREGRLEARQAANPGAQLWPDGADEVLRHAFSAHVFFVACEGQAATPRTAAGFAMCAALSFGGHPLGSVGDIVLERAAIHLEGAGFGVSPGTVIRRENGLKLNGGEISLRPVGGPLSTGWSIVSLSKAPLDGLVDLDEPPMCILDDNGGQGVEVCLTTFPRYLRLVDVDDEEIERAAASLDPPLETPIGDANKQQLIKKVLAGYVAANLARRGDEVVVGRYRYSRKVG